jgi:hypothetical protein
MEIWLGQSLVVVCKTRGQKSHKIGRTADPSSWTSESSHGPAIAKDSPFYRSRNRTTFSYGRSSGNSLDSILMMQNPCNSRTRSPLGAPRNLYREFEFLSLRHAVWNAEKLGNIALKIAGHSEGQQGARSQLRDHYRALLRQVE